MQIVSAQEAVSIVKSDNRVFFQGAAMTPNLLIDTLCERYKELNFPRYPVQLRDFQLQREHLIVLRKTQLLWWLQ